MCNEIGDSTNIYSIEISMYGFVTEDPKVIRPYTEEDCEQKPVTASHLDTNNAFSDLMHGRRICRSFWEYFKVTHVIPEAPVVYNPFAANAPPFAPTGDGMNNKESSFSMIRLRTIAEQKDIYSSLESLDDDSSESSDSSSESSTSSDDDDEEAVDDDDDDALSETSSFRRRWRRRKGESYARQSFSSEEPPLSIITHLKSRRQEVEDGSGRGSMEVRGKNMPISGKRSNSNFADMVREKVIHYNVDLANGKLRQHVSREQGLQ
jgi:hypothetical protein